MLTLCLTTEAKQELYCRSKDMEELANFRLEMRHSCFMKVKVTQEREIRQDDYRIYIEGISIVVNKDQLHFFNNKVLDFLPDKTGFKQFDITEQN